MEREEYLPISMLNQYAYCPRRFWLMYVQGEMVINAPVLEGTLQHERVHSGGQGQEDGEARYRRLYLWSDRLQVSGFADLVEERAGVLMPVEYKHGKQGQWGNDHIQLCAQALCLEERTGSSVPVGQIFYWGSRRRVTVEFDTALRTATERAVADIQALLEAGVIPDPEQPYAKCRECSLEPICLPREVKQLREKVDGRR
ncbi:MAG TPA: CRISPR-associated protein Cas4 [Anaerolineae bacterium]|nr:CRISPR-associated protein Cas4 [Anaerolineae bacterium]HQI84564.1 CRISPR-associated protein Cas4 [Anaerolineae bacterium]